MHGVRRVAAVGSHLRGNNTDREAISLAEHRRGGGMHSLYSFEPHQRRGYEYDDDRRSGCVSRRCVFSGSRLGRDRSFVDVRDMLKELEVSGHLSELMK